MGRIICAGLGPGNPDLISVRAHRVIREARQVAFFRKRGVPGMARRIVEGLLQPNCVEHAMEYPFTTEIPLDDPRYTAALAAFYDNWAQLLCERTSSSDVVVLCEGDPFFYGSFMHLFVRLQGCVDIEVIPGITGMSGAWTEADLPIAWGNDVCTVLMGTLEEDALARHMAGADAIIVMKMGRHLPKVIRALEKVKRLEEAWLVQQATMDGQRIMRLRDAGAAESSYFATVLVPGHGRRPILPG